MLLRAFLILSLFSLAPLTAAGHARLKPGGNFPPRNTNPGIKTGPCGGLARTTPVVYTAGQTVTVEWEETIKHTGRFLFYFATANDAGLYTGVGNPPPALLEVPQNPALAVPAQYSAQLKLPNTPCEACTLQLIQVMIDNHPEMPTYYYSCADVKLVAPSASPTPSPSGSPTPAPSPSPTPTPTPPCP